MQTPAIAIIKIPKKSRLRLILSVRKNTFSSDMRENGHDIVEQGRI